MSWLFFSIIGLGLLTLSSLLLLKNFFNKSANVFFPFLIIALNSIGITFLHLANSSAILNYKYDLAINGVGNLAGVVSSSLILFLGGFWSLFLFIGVFASSLFLLPNLMKRYKEVD